MKIFMTLENYITNKIKKNKKNCPIGSIAINYKSYFKNVYRHTYAAEKERR